MLELNAVHVCCSHFYPGHGWLKVGEIVKKKQQFSWLLLIDP